MFFSDTHWPQLMAPFYSILFATSFCQFNSFTSVPNEFGERLTRDQRPFLHTGILQTLQIPSSMLILFPLQFFIRMAMAEPSFCAQWPIFCVNFDGAFGSLFCWKIQPQPIIRLSDPKTQLFSAIIQLWSLESLWPLKLSSSHCIKTI